MGLEIGRTQFDAAEFERFSARLGESLDALEELLARPGFGVGPTTLGAELELFLVDGVGRPLPLNREVLTSTLDPRLTVELDRFNLECNLRPSVLPGRPFEALAKEMSDAVAEASRAARVHGGDVAMIGILPTLVAEDLQRAAMTDAARYRALSAALRQLRGGPFRLRIDGDEPLDVTCDDVTFEGANTSLQIHLRVPPERFADVFNGAQLATAPAMALATNAPIFLGHRLWEETRVAVFKQSVDDRRDGRSGESRVAFGSGWVDEGPLELFERAVSRHAPLLPLLSDESPLEIVRKGGVPALEELRLHYGTVWHWNRPVYDPTNGGHVRIELRGLPAGPTVRDMVANAAYLIGLSLGLARDARSWISELPFAVPDHNFYRAAQSGLDADFLFPTAPSEPAREISARALAQALLPLAREGLVDAGVDETEAEGWLAPIARRLESQQTGARWQRAVVDALEPAVGRPRALSSMFARYRELAGDGDLVADWPTEVALPDLPVVPAPPPAAVPESVEDFLRELGGPAALRLPGRDRSRTRVAVTLLHGNEPSGVRAMHGMLRSGFEPAVDALLLIASVDAALEAPGFARRHLSGARDLNRCFVDRLGREGALASAILDVIAMAEPEAIVDLHNNTGRSIPYGVGPRAGDAELSLISLFADRYVHSDLELGALVEVVAPRCPSVVVECGRAGAPGADAVARAGLERYLGAPRLGIARGGEGVDVFCDPVRVEIVDGIALGLGEGPREDADLTIAPELDHHNFGRLAPGHVIGWRRPGAPWPLRAVRPDGEDVSGELFEDEGGALRARRELVPIMITNDPGIALGDCLFYVVRPSTSRG